MKSMQLRQPFAKTWFVWGSVALSALALSIFLRDYERRGSVPVG